MVRLSDKVSKPAPLHCPSAGVWDQRGSWWGWGVCIPTCSQGMQTSPPSLAFSPGSWLSIVLSPPCLKSSSSHKRRCPLGKWRWNQRHGHEKSGRGQRDTREEPGEVLVGRGLERMGREEGRPQTAASSITRHLASSARGLTWGLTPSHYLMWNRLWLVLVEENT